jgi:hypothetical protein
MQGVVKGNERSYSALLAILCYLGVPGYIPLMPHSKYPNDSTKSPIRRRSDAGQIRLQPRDVTGLVTLAEMYAAPYDLLALQLGVTPDRLRGITARWRGAGLAATGQLAEGPSWCWLTPAGMRQVGHQWEAAPPPLARLAHVRAVLAARLWLEAGEAWQAGRAWWRCERRVRDGRTVGGRGHLPDAEVLWPSVAGSPRAGETWAIEVELTPKAAARTQQIMAGLLAQPYAQAVYLCAPAAFQVVSQAAGKFPPDQAARVLIRKLPAAALMRGAA